MTDARASTDPAVTQDTSVPALEAVGLTKHFRLHGSGRDRSRQTVVHACESVSVALHPGRVTAVVGESGSGKSTFARMLARLIEPTSGRIRLDGREVSLSTSRDARRYRRTVQLVLQDPFASLNPIHTIRYHLSRPLKIHKMVHGRAELDHALEKLLARVKLSPAHQYLDKLPHELSGGQLQRVSIARALAVEPRVLLADEPVSMLDVSIRLGVLNLLEELRDDEGLALLYVTHDIASARYIADTIMVMYAGEVVECGPSTSITDSPAHPYTQLLLSAAPDPDRASPAQLTATGTPPSLVKPPSGCRFHPRCPHAMAICAVERPPTVDVAAGQRAACWLFADTGADGRPTLARTTTAMPGNRPNSKEM